LFGGLAGEVLLLADGAVVGASFGAAEWAGHAPFAGGDPVEGDDGFAVGAAGPFVCSASLLGHGFGWSWRAVVVSGEVVVFGAQLSVDGGFRPFAGGGVELDDGAVVAVPGDAGGCEFGDDAFGVVLDVVGDGKGVAGWGLCAADFDVGVLGVGEVL
jgi:hypothetical protein